MENIKQLLTVPFSQANYKKFSINLGLTDTLVTC